MPENSVMRSRFKLFLVGDCLFLIAVSSTGTIAMHMMHGPEWAFLFECVSGMVIAMLLAMLMAFAVAPILGSIESMTSSMVVSMLSPMLVCAAHLSGGGTGVTGALAIGVAAGIGMFAFVQAYGVSCRKRLEASVRIRSGEPSC